MDWRIKASLQKVLSLSRIGDKLNHIPVTLNKNYHYNVVRYQHYECLRKFGYISLNLSSEKCVGLEIGTGYSLISPIILYLLGFNKVITVDIDKDANFKTFQKQVPFLLKEEFVKEIANIGIYTENEIKEKLNAICSCRNLDDILKFCNIRYIAPYSLNDIENEVKYFDYISSQVVFEHIPPEFLEQLFKKFKAWLKKGSYTVHTINFIDHYANHGIFEDKSISEFNFLRFSDSYWKFWSGNSIAYTNRLCYLYYQDLFEENDIEILDFIGENYRSKKELDLQKIHKDVLQKYKSQPNLEELVKYQRGTFICKSRL